MFAIRCLLALSVGMGALSAATFGTAVALVGGAADLVLDEARGRLYLVNSSQSRIEVYSLAQRRFLNPVSTDSTPISCAISRNGKSLYVTSYDASSLNVLDLDTLAVRKRVSLPAKPEGVAVGIDERALITTIGSGTNNTANVVLLYDPNAQAGDLALINIPVTPPAPTPPTLPAPSSRPFLSSRSQLVPSFDGRFIIGANLPNTTTRTVFVYEVSSGTILRSRTVANASSVIAVSPDGSKFMAGLTLFDSQTLQVIAQQNIANSPYPISPTTNFNTQSTQGGSVYSPDGSIVYSAFDISPVQTPAARPNVSQLMLSDPDNLLINLGLQLPENLSGKMVISRDGANIYALSDSGFVIVPMSTMTQFPIVNPDSTVTALASDQCGVTAGRQTARITTRNAGRGTFTATASLLQYTATVPPIGGGGGGIPGQATAATQPTIRTVNGASPAFDFAFNATVARTLGTAAPPHDILLQSTQAINIPNRVRVYQNTRNAESRGDVLPVATNISDTEGLTDLVYDSRRQRLYISNSGMNRVEVFDIARRQFLTPIKVGQLPRSLALTPDGNTLYVVNTGGESISIVDPDLLKIVDNVIFPAIPINTNLAIITPTLIAASQRGAMFLTSTGQLWRIVGNQAVPRGVSAVIGASATGIPNAVAAPRSIAATPAGERIIVASGNGFVYLYDALADDFVQGRQIFTGPQQGYQGPVSAGPKGAYYLVNGYVLNEALTPIAQPPTSGAAALPVGAVTAAAAANFVRYSQLPRANANVAADPGSLEVVDLNGNSLRSSPALEAPTIQAVTGRAAAIDGRTIAVDVAGTTAYMLTEGGLSIIPLDPIPATDRPTPTARGTVNAASYQTNIAPNTLIAIFGRTLAAGDQAATVPLPTVLGGVCVTLNNNPLPLFMTSAGQINAQIPPTLATGNYPLIVRSIDKKLASASQTITIAKYAPAVLVDPVSGQIALYHKDGRAVNQDNPATRDEPLTMYALGLGATKGGAVTAGNPSPASPLAVTDTLEVFFGNPLIKEAGIIVDWSGLTPGFIGLYQLNLRIPGTHINGDALPVTIKIGTVSSPTTGPVVPKVSVN